MHSILAAAFALAVAVPAAAQTFAWDFASGTLPTAAGWSEVNDDDVPLGLTPDGLLIGPSTRSGSAGYLYDLDSLYVPGSPVSIEATLRIIDTTSGDQGGILRSGYTLAFVENTGRGAVIQFANDGVTLVTTDGSVTSPTFAFDTTSAFNTYRLDIADASATVSINGIEVLSSSQLGGLGLGPTRAFFGDLTILGNSESITRSVTLSIPSPPAAATLLVLGVIQPRRRAIGRA